jgi:hypothetical protein
MYTEYKSAFFSLLGVGWVRKRLPEFPVRAIFQLRLPGVPCPAFTFISLFLHPNTVFLVEGEGKGASQIG